MGIKLTSNVTDSIIGVLVMVLRLAISVEHTAGVLSGYTHRFRPRAKVAYYVAPC